MSATHVRRLRLGAAFVLLTYVVLHFLNHSLGLISLAAMEAGRWWFLALWRSWPGTLALYGAIVVHGVLALWLLYQRRSLRMPAWEALQYALGLLIPALLVVHVTHFNALFWDAGSTPVRVIEHGIVDPGPLYSGDLPRAAVVINENESCPMRIPAYSAIGKLAELLISRVTCPSNAASMKPAVL